MKLMLLRGTTAHVLLHVICLLARGGERFQCTTNGMSLGISCTPRSTCRRPGMSLSEQAWKKYVHNCKSNNQASLETSGPKHRCSQALQYIHGYELFQARAKLQDPDRFVMVMRHLARLGMEIVFATRSHLHCDRDWVWANPTSW